MTNPNCLPENFEKNSPMIFAELTQIRRMVQRFPIYKKALQEALPESEGYDAWLAKLLDPTLSNADIGAAARTIVRDYIKEVVAYRGDEL